MMSSITYDRGGELEISDIFVPCMPMADTLRTSFPNFECLFSMPGEKLSEASVNRSEADMNPEVTVSSIVPAERGSRLELLESLPARLGITEYTSSSVRLPNLQPSNISKPSNFEAADQGKGGPSKRSASPGRVTRDVQHSMPGRRRQWLQTSTKPGSSLQVRQRRDAKGISARAQPGVVHRKDRSHLVAREKRPRSPTWSAHEKDAYLELKEEASRVVKGKLHWDFISRNLKQRWGFERSSKCCEDFWYTLLKSYRAIRGHQLMESNVVPQCTWVSYWNMDEEKRSQKQLPKSFSLKWCEIIERILDAQKKRDGKKIISGGSITQQEYLLDDECSDHQQPQLGDMMEPAEMAEYYAGRSGRMSAIPEEPILIEQRVDDADNFALDRSSKRLGEDLDDDLIRLVKQRVQDVFNEDYLMTTLLPVFKKHFEDVLEHTLRPVASLLQEKVEEQEFQEQRRALAAWKRALDLEEMQLLKRRRGGRHPPTWRVSHKQPRGPREKKSEGVILV